MNMPDQIDTRSARSAACDRSGKHARDQFGDITKMVLICSGAKRAVKDVPLSRHARNLATQIGRVE